MGTVRLAVALSMLEVVRVSVQRWARNRGVLFHHNWGAGSRGSPSTEPIPYGYHSTRRCAEYVGSGRKRIRATVGEKSGSLIHHRWGRPG